MTNLVFTDREGRSSPPTAVSLSSHCSQSSSGGYSSASGSHSSQNLISPPALPLFAVHDVGAHYDDDYEGDVMLERGNDGYIDTEERLSKDRFRLPSSSSSSSAVSTPRPGLGDDCGRLGALRGTFFSRGTLLYRLLASMPATSPAAEISSSLLLACKSYDTDVFSQWYTWMRLMTTEKSSSEEIPNDSVMHQQDLEHKRQNVPIRASPSHNLTAKKMEMVLHLAIEFERPIDEIRTIVQRAPVTTRCKMVVVTPCNIAATVTKVSSLGKREGSSFVSLLLARSHDESTKNTPALPSMELCRYLLPLHVLSHQWHMIGHVASTRYAEEVLLTLLDEYVAACTCGEGNIDIKRGSEFEMAPSTGKDRRPEIIRSVSTKNDPKAAEAFPFLRCLREGTKVLHWYLKHDKKVVNVTSDDNDPVVAECKIRWALHMLSVTLRHPSVQSERFSMLLRPMQRSSADLIIEAAADVPHLLSTIFMAGESLASWAVGTLLIRRLLLEPIAVRDAGEWAWRCVCQPIKRDLYLPHLHFLQELSHISLENTLLQHFGQNGNGNPNHDSGACCSGLLPATLESALYHSYAQKIVILRQTVGAPCNAVAACASLSRCTQIRLLTNSNPALDLLRAARCRQFTRFLALAIPPVELVVLVSLIGTCAEGGDLYRYWVFFFLRNVLVGWIMRCLGCGQVLCIRTGWLRINWVALALLHFTHHLQQKGLTMDVEVEGDVLEATMLLCDTLLRLQTVAILKSYCRRLASLNKV
mmetsp:Transcript_22235/g.50915  ORF Transcript_22235/g.50915 Transcript_22235/m.50915 type:complete len:756 (+) Transcript_22235:51-2318(+)|eukprot:CAMPEP_0113300658 /NCGR_PEP_ID=MMETSP0010_2-20120614/2196_1 /TAXON_ID=216773 ORGANISM="Corethron hystrix, Strain 308" /NCGR_SAMPLE_ID=MMETSP0010_2 /ASSEMBLY_ACC=CAM_ASM_000155 /LENGTH=755 /DNA_ID=CAMNT_0000154119 /DNA_START=35 /DNA_END=2302 /DNA_ORIENTATION=- /assembly_acc=CAM_ASM_000155